MFKHLFKGVLSAIAVTLLTHYRHLSIQLLKIEAAKSYLHGVRMARLTVIGLMQMGLVIGFICIGMLLFHAGLFILLPWTVKAKAVLGLFLGVIYVITGGVALYVAMDEKAWMAKSGAAKMLEKITGQSKK
jgi:hypothetical protein